MQASKMGSTVATGGKAAMGRCQSIGIKLRDFILKGNVGERQLPDRRDEGVCHACPFA